MDKFVVKRPKVEVINDRSSETTRPTNSGSILTTRPTSSGSILAIAGLLYNNA